VRVVQVVERMPHVKALEMIADVGAFLDEAQQKEQYREGRNTTEARQRMLVEDASTWYVRPSRSAAPLLDTHPNGRRTDSCAIRCERSSLSPAKGLHHQRSSRHAMVPLSHTTVAPPKRGRSSKFAIPCRGRLHRTHAVYCRANRPARTRATFETTAHLRHHRMRVQVPLVSHVCGDRATGA
jgi:hypothetical protein